MKEMQVRILCGTYSPTSPFIEGGCMCDWLEIIDPVCSIQCPGCGDECPEEFVQHAIGMLRERVVFVMGCPHRAFTFSRRSREPYFYPHETPEEARESGELPSGS